MTSCTSEQFKCWPLKFIMQYYIKGHAQSYQPQPQYYYMNFYNQQPRAPSPLREDYSVVQAPRVPYPRTPAMLVGRPAVTTRRPSPFNSRSPSPIQLQKIQIMPPLQQSTKRKNRLPGLSPMRYVSVQLGPMQSNESEALGQGRPQHLEQQQGWLSQSHLQAQDRGHALMMRSHYQGSGRKQAGMPMSMSYIQPQGMARGSVSQIQYEEPMLQRYEGAVRVPIVQYEAGRWPVSHIQYEGAIRGPPSSKVRLSQVQHEGAGRSPTKQNYSHRQFQVAQQAPVYQKPYQDVSRSPTKEPMSHIQFQGPAYIQYQGGVGLMKESFSQLQFTGEGQQARRRQEGQFRRSPLKQANREQTRGQEQFCEDCEDCRREREQNERNRQGHSNMN